MASLARITPPLMFLHFFFLLSSLFHASFAEWRLQTLDPAQPLVLPYHNGSLLSGNVSLNLLWYGTFTPAQKSIITDFIAALSDANEAQPSVSGWWNTTAKYYPLTSDSRASIALSLGDQATDENCSLGKSLTGQQLTQLATSSGQPKQGAISVVLTAADVAVEDFCSGSCGTHGSVSSSVDGTKSAYIWVGNPETQCPGQCSWPFHQPTYGPQVPALVAPNGDVGADGMVINLGSLLAGAVTNPFGDGFYQGDASTPLEASSACPGIFGSGAYSGFPGKLLVDSTTGASYNTQGIGGRKYLVPAMYDPTTSSCFTPV